MQGPDCVTQAALNRPEQNLLQDETLLTLAIIESSPDFVSVLDTNCIYRRVNPAYEKAFGRPAAEIVGKHVSEVLGEEQFERFSRPNLKRALSGKKVEYATWFDAGRQGRRFLAITYTLLPRHRRGAVEGVLVTGRDNTEQKLAEDRLLESEERYRTLVESMNDGLAVGDEHHKIVLVNDRFCQMLGFGRDELMGKKVADFVAAGSRRLFKRQMAGRRRGQSAQYELVWRTADDSELATLVSPQPQFDEQGRFSGSIAVVTDISELKRATDAVIESEDRYRTLYELAPVMMHSIDSETRLLRVNKAWQKTLGYSADEVIGQPVTKFIAPEFREYVASKLVPAFFKTGVQKGVAYSYVRKDGERVEVVLSALAERNAEGAVVGSIAVLNDVTEQKRAQRQIEALNTELEQRVKARTTELRATNRELRSEIARGEEAAAARRQSEQQLRILTNALPVLINYVDTSERYRLNNSAYEEWFGRRPEELNGKRVRDVVGKGAYDVIGPYIQRALAGERVTFEAHVPFRLGGPRHCQTSYVPHADENGTVVGFFSVVSDVSGRVEAEQKLSERQEELARVLRANAMGEMAATLAHQMNQPLAAISNYARGGLLRLGNGADPLGSQWARAFEQIADQAERASEMIDRIDRFVRRSGDKTEAVDINQIAESAASLVEREARVHKVNIKSMLDHTVPPVKVGAIEMEQVILNLLRNGVDASKSGKGKREVTVQTYANGDDIEVAIADRGVGLPVGSAHRLFEPFFTTKTGGMGMGLRISRSVVERYGGRIWAVDNPDRGATFTFALPTAPERSALDLR